MFVDSEGLVCEGRRNLEVHKEEFALPQSSLGALQLTQPLPTTLEEIVKQVRPTVLIGTTGTPGTFTRATLRALIHTAQAPATMTQVGTTRPIPQRRHTQTRISALPSP